MSALDRRRITLGDVDVEFFEGGKGQPLLWLHDGIGLSDNTAFAERLAADFHVVAPLHPGFGGSSLPAWMNAVDDFAHVDLALARRLALDHAIVAGASLGAWVAAEMATKATYFIDRLVLIGPLGIKTGPVDRLEVPDIFALPQAEIDRLLYMRPDRWRLDPASKSDADLKVVAQDRETLALVAWEPYMHNPKLRHRLHAIDRPTLVLRGAHDGFVSSDTAEAFARLIPNARSMTIPDAAHLAHIEQPERVADAIRRFLDG